MAASSTSSLSIHVPRRQPSSTIPAGSTSRPDSPLSSHFSTSSTAPLAAVSGNSVSSFKHRHSYSACQTPGLDDSDFRRFHNAAGMTSSSSYIRDENEDTDGRDSQSAPLLPASAQSSDAKGKSRADDAPVGRGTASNYSTPVLSGSNSGVFDNSNHAYHDDESAFYDQSSHLGHDSNNIRMYDIHPNSPSPRMGTKGSGHGKKSSLSIIDMSSSPAWGATVGSSSNKYDHPLIQWLRTTRLHPLALGPAFILGAILALSGLFGTGGDQSSTGWKSYLPFGGGGSAIARPTYVSHSSGHIFMNQARTSLGQIEHPVHGLIKNATKQWNNLVARQSKSLGEAVREYKRRYGKNPPKGFEKWYEFASSRNVVLIDEYDQINRDITPFLSLSPTLLAARIKDEEDSEFSHTFVIKNGHLEITGAKKELGRAKDQAELIDSFLKLLPDVNITMSAHDGPSVLMDYSLRLKHETAGQSGTRVTDDEAANVNDDMAMWGFNLACPPDSRIQRSYNGLEYGALPDGPSFIQDHLKTMDLCANPEWQYMHGFTSWAGPRPKVLRPLFSFAKTTMHSDLLCVPLEQFVNTPTSDPEWEEKKHSKIIWRGSMTGVWYDGITWWRTSQRSRLHFMSQASSGTRWVRFVKKIGGKERVREEEVDLVALNEKYLDAGYVGELHQCTPHEGGCEAIPKHIQTVQGMDWESQNDYKYIVDMDGNAWSGRFHRLMASNSLVFKSTIFPEWYSERVMPWVHYVPLKIDYSDLYDLMAFFAGDLNGEGSHDDLAKAIAYNGKEWTQKHWRWEDMQAYAFRLYLEWARVTAPDQTNVDYVE